MAEWWESMPKAEDAAKAPPAAPPPIGGPNWWEQMPTAQELTQGSGRTPRPVGDTLAKGATTMQATAASLAPDASGQIKIFSKQMNIPENRFGVVDGEIVYADENGELQRAVPSVGGGGRRELLPRLSSFIGSQVGPMLPQLTAGAVGAGMGPTGWSIPATALTAAATDTGRQFVANQIIGEEGRGVDWANVVGQAGMAGGGQAVGKAANWAFSRNPMGIQAFDRATAMDPANRAQIDALEAEARRRGINLSAGQATDMRSLLQQERQLGRYPETADIMYQRGQVQRGQEVPAAIRSEIDALSPQRGEAAIKGFTGAAEDIAQTEIEKRSAAARINYGKALDGKDPYLDDNLKLLMQRPSLKDAFAQAQKLAAEEGVELPKFMEVTPEGKIIVTQAPDWRSWDYMKRGLDAVIDANTNEFGRVNSVGRAVSNTKREILKILDNANPEYAAARGQYGTASDAVDAILNGGIGELQKMDGPARISMLDKVFNGTGRNSLRPEEVSRMRQAYLLAGKIDDWNAGLATWINDGLSIATKEAAQGASVGNVPGKFRASLWGDERQKEVLKAALGDPTKIASFEKLMEVLQAASRSLPEASPTATDMAAMVPGQTLGPAAKFVSKALSPSTYANLGVEIAQGIDALRSPAARQKLAQAMLSGDYADQLSKLRMLPPTGEKALSVVGQILTGAGVIGSGQRVPNDFAPPLGAKQ